jgi:hypothetical protein
MDSDKRSSPEQRRLEDILKYLDVDDELEAEELDSPKEMSLM